MKDFKMKGIVLIIVTVLILAGFSAIKKSVYTAQDEPLEQNAFYEGEFILSSPPGFHEEPFYLNVSVHGNPNAVIW